MQVHPRCHTQPSVAGARPMASSMAASMGPRSGWPSCESAAALCALRTVSTARSPTPPAAVRHLRRPSLISRRYTDRARHRWSGEDRKKRTRPSGVPSWCAPAPTCELVRLHSLGPLTPGESAQTVKQKRSACAGSTPCSTRSDRKTTARLKSGATRTGAAPNGTNSISPPSPGSHSGLRYTTTVRARLEGGPGLSWCSGKHAPRPSLRCTLRLTAAGGPVAARPSGCGHSGPLAARATWSTTPGTSSMKKRWNMGMALSARGWCMSSSWMPGLGSLAPPNTHW
mmetsp:Transcript_10300/g.35028  ORF Transcript_10300/g.35028 Transcript_10300/m.35028 type:complete len:284 (+) Transcript_10300:124-975(+)